MPASSAHRFDLHRPLAALLALACAATLAGCIQQPPEDADTPEPKDAIVAPAGTADAEGEPAIVVPEAQPSVEPYTEQIPPTDVDTVAPEPAPIQVPAPKLDPQAGTLAPAPSNAELAGLIKSNAFMGSHLQKLNQMQTEAQQQESAPWFGTTGLSTEQEQRLPRYVRMELNQKLEQADAVKAQDLQFIGRFNEADGTVYYWQLPPNEVSKKPATRGSARYAYLRQAQNGNYLDWGNRLPPSP